MSSLVNTLTFATTTFAETSWRFELLKNKNPGCRSAKERLKDCGSDLKCHSERIVCRFSPSHSRSGTFTGTERKRHQSKATSGDTFVMIDIVPINKTKEHPTYVISKLCRLSDVFINSGWPVPVVMWTMSMWNTVQWSGHQQVRMCLAKLFHWITIFCPYKHTKRSQASRVI